MCKYILLYLALMNIVAFILYGIDKWKSRHDKWRVKESCLLTVAILGGSLGAFLGMKIWHHKTKHLLFAYGVPIILIIHLLALLLLHYGCFTD